MSSACSWFSRFLWLFGGSFVVPYRFEDCSISVKNDFGVLIVIVLSL